MVVVVAGFSSTSGFLTDHAAIQVVVFFYLLDVATDWNLFRSMQRVYLSHRNTLQDIEAFPSGNLSCLCECSQDRGCRTPLEDTNVCNAFRENEDSSCNLDRILPLVDERNGQCTFEFGLDKTNSLLDELNVMRWVSLGINCVMTPLTLYYLFYLARKRHFFMKDPAVATKKKEEAEITPHQIEIIRKSQNEQRLGLKLGPGLEQNDDVNMYPMPEGAVDVCYNCHLAMGPSTV